MTTPSPVRIAIAALKPSLDNAVHAEIAPQGAAMPYAIVHLVGWDSERDLTAPTDTGQAHITVACFGPAFGEADQLALTVSGILRDYSGTVGEWHAQVVRDGPNASDWVAALQAFRMTLGFALSISPASA